MDAHHRLSDSDRREAVARLRAHCRAGRLTSEELGVRTGRVGHARVRADLDAVFADLPHDDPAWGRGWRDRRWRTHAVAFLLLTAAALALWQRTRDPDPLPRDYGADYWWPLWAAFAWAAAVLLHFLTATGLLGPVGGSRLNVPRPGSPEAAAGPAEAAPDAAPVEPPTAGAEVLDRLTAREREVLAMVGLGHSNKDIARALFISERTARTHVSNILRKLDLPSRTHAALLAHRAGADVS